MWMPDGVALIVKGAAKFLVRNDPELGPHEREVTLNRATELIFE